MFENIPNWHPAIAHFPIALLLTGIGALWISALLRDSALNRQLQDFGHWSLRIGFVFSLIAMWSGVLAYLNVPRDGVAHEAMNLHYDMAGIVVAGLLPFFILSCLRYRLTRHITRVFTAGLVIPAMLVIYTASLGYEAVYRYGLGVQRAEQIESSDGQHIHGAGETHPEDGSLSNQGNVRYPDKNFEQDTGVSDTGELQD